MSRASAHSVEGAPWALVAALLAAFVYLVTLLGNGSVLPPLNTALPGSENAAPVEVALAPQTTGVRTPQPPLQVIGAPALLQLAPPGTVLGVQRVSTPQPPATERKPAAPAVQPAPADSKPGRGRSDEKRKARLETKLANHDAPGGGGRGGGHADAPRGHGAQAGPKPAKGHAGPGREKRGKAAGQAKQGGPKSK